jgi:hypothetical protein
MVATAEFSSGDEQRYPGRRVVNFGGQLSRLSAGPAHVAGLIYTVDFWRPPETVLAAFQRFDGDFEVWQATARVGFMDASWEYVIFCDDYRDIQNIKKVYDTNGGETFRITSTF